MPHEGLVPLARDGKDEWAIITIRSISPHAREER